MNPPCLKICIIFLLHLLIHGIIAQDCGSEWSYNITVNLCYKLVHQPGLSWTAGRSMCLEQGADLAVLSTPVKHNAVVDYVRSINEYAEDIWIGLFFSDEDGPSNGKSIQERRIGWKWTDGSLSDPSTWSQWRESEPGGAEPYARLRVNEWRGIGKSGSFEKALCEKAPDSRLRPKPTPQPTPHPTPAPTPQPTFPTPRLATPQSTSRTSAPMADCGEANWQYLEKTKVCYSLLVSQSALNWEEAEAKCKTMDGHLATPSTADQHETAVDFIRLAQLERSAIWIGLNHENGASGRNLRLGWKWQDNSTYGFMAWEQNEPGSGERYVRMRDGMWWGIYGGTYNHYLCQKDPVYISTTTTIDKPTSLNKPEDTFGGGGNTVGDGGKEKNKTGDKTQGKTKNVKFAAFAVLVVPVVFCMVFITVHMRRREVNEKVAKSKPQENGDEASFYETISTDVVEPDKIATSEDDPYYTHLQ